MPTYTYTCGACKHSFERVSSVSGFKRRVRCIKCRKAVAHDFMADHSVTRHVSSTWPRVSVAAGVAPSQAKEAYEKSVKDGVPTQFTKDGDPVFTSQRHETNYLRTIGMFNRSAGGSPRNL